MPEVFDELISKNESPFKEVKLLFVEFAWDARKPIPEIAFSVFSCLDVCKFLLGSISEPTIASTSSETLNPEPL